MALGRESPHRSPHISRKVTVSYGPGSHVVQNLSHKQSPPPPPPTIDALPDAVLLRIFHFLQRPFASGPLPKASRLCSIKSATRVSLKTGRQTITVPYEVCVGSVCRRWRMVSYSLPHASVLDLAAYLPVHILLRVSLTERGLDRAYDLFTADPERIRHVRGLNIHCPGVSSVCLKRLLRSCSAVKNLPQTTRFNYTPGLEWQRKLGSCEKSPCRCE
ncbi:hypothetical protein BC832DRAFT_28423 [Gaertneriomyces semiglobifer]|nr:hypothetical protein BC832DRAFT_28423 [Gaertneriomyces semiglobifer]